MHHALRLPLREQCLHGIHIPRIGDVPGDAITARQCGARIGRCRRMSDTHNLHRPRQQRGDDVQADEAGGAGDEKRRRQ
nr:hypothetical protein [Roseomonas oleicola]